MEGKINFYQSEDTSNKKPHFKGYIEIAGEVHQFAVWPAKSGKGYSGTYKPKGDYMKPEESKGAPAKPQPYDDDSLIPF